VKSLHGLASLVAAIVVALSIPLFAAIQLAPVASGLSSPLFVTHAGDGSNRLFIVERAGVIKVLQPGGGSPTVFLDITDRLVDGGEQGLLGLAFHPLYEDNGRFFVYYTDNSSNLVLAEYHVSADPNVASTSETLMLTIPHPGQTNHNGGMLAFGADNLLYIGVGDGGGGNDPQNNAQNLGVLLGKILRIDIDPPEGSGLPYVSPESNPFFGMAGRRDEIFAYGMRNPWRFSFDKLNQQLWTLCGASGYIAPLFEYAHANGRCSITGGYVYRGTQNALPDGTYVYGDYCTGEIFGWDGTQALLLDTGLNISSFGEDESGELYVVGLGGTVSRIVSTTPCSFSIAPTSQSVGAGGGSNNVGVTAGSGCDWTAVSNASWIDVTSGASGSGNGSVGYSVDANTTSTPRSGTMTVAGQTFTVNQAGAAACAYSISPARANFSSAGGTGTVSVTTGPNCGWAAVSGDTWITVTGGSGPGSGAVTYSVAPYSGRQGTRNGKVTIAGQTFTVKQSR
jgi:hypothetical protein